MNPYYDSVRRLYLAGKLSEAGIQSAVTRGWITPEQAAEIQTGGEANE